MNRNYHFDVLRDKFGMDVAPKRLQEMTKNKIKEMRVPAIKIFCQNSSFFSSKY